MTLVRSKVLAVAVTAAVTATLAAAPAAQAHGKTRPLGTKSLAAVLTADTGGFDHNGKDFDILTAAVLAVLKAKPASPVKVLTDAAFQQLAKEVTHARRTPTEKQAFTTVAGLGIDTVEAVLLYHVVPGATVDRAAAVRANGTKLATAAGASITVRVSHRWCRGPKVSLVDADTNDRNPVVVKFDINKGNRQVAHAIDAVLRPVDLP
jgi:uncharacterized surface protein with fasciclin (FAS1) repeats